jgi:[NiFe] hydrogenase assembly HybE family chaperone
VIDARVRQLEAVFRGIAATRMADVPICHPRLSVRAIGFERCADEPAVAWGVLVTPWFMNLVRLPLQQDAAALGERESATRVHGGHAFDFLGAFEPELGAFESCSLFSPMFDFADQHAAEATAREVLALLRAPAAAPSPPAPPAVAAGPSRRGLLFGRGASERRP